MTKVTIPAHWTAEQASSICDFLHDLIEALWNVHGDKMAAEYARASLTDDSAERDDYTELEDIPAEDIPW